MLLRRHYTKPVEEQEVKEEKPLEPVEKALEYDDITKREIISELEELEVGHNKRDTKKELFELLNKFKGW